MRPLAPRSVARIVVASSHPPFARGGHLTIGTALVDALRSAGHETELLLTPQNRFGRQGAAYLATRLTDVGVGHDDRPVDQIITLRFPSYALRHPRHVCWINHTMREYYDLWDGFEASLSRRNWVKERARRWAIRTADRRLLGRVTRLYAQSKTVRRRLHRWLGLDAEVLYPPAPPRAYRCDGYDGELFAVSRLEPHKRLDLLIRALSVPEASAARIAIAGEGPERAALERLAIEVGVGDRVRFLGWTSEDDLVDRLARCRAVCFMPLDEDYGFVTVEAFAAGKAVVTCTDAGGPAELVEDGRTGFVCDPTPESVGAAVGRLAADRALAAALGAAAARRGATLSWADVADRLVLHHSR